MRSVVIEMAHVLIKNSAGVSLVVDQHPVDALGADAADEPFRIAVRSRRWRRDLHDVDVFGGKDGVEGVGELGVPVADQKPNVVICSPRSISRLRAACTVQATVG